MFSSHHTAAIAASVVLCLTLLAGCGGDETTASAPVPKRVPPGAVAVVGSASISRHDFDHWLAIMRREHPRADARAAALAFLIKAKWLEQQADQEGVDHAALATLVDRSLAGSKPLDGSLTRLDQRLRARTDLIAEALQRRHSAVPGKVGHAAVVRYYRTHRSQFKVPAVHHTLVIVTRQPRTAREARAALERGRPWATVARRYSIDSSAAIGGRYAVAAGTSPPSIVRAAGRAPQGRLVGPLRAVALAEGQPRYYLFRVTRTTPARQQTLAQVAAQIRQTLRSQESAKALDDFESAFRSRWRMRTLCAPNYVVPQCGNYAASRR